MPRTRSTTKTGTGTSSARSESHVEEEQVHWRKRIEQRLFQNYVVGSLSKLKLLPNLFQDRESSSLVCDDDHEQDQEHSLPVIQEVQSRSGELKKTAEDHDDFLGKVRTGGSVVNDEILGFAKLFNDELNLDNISRIKNDDKMIQSKGGVDALSEDELRETCRQRGMLGLRSVEEMRQQQHYFKMEADDEHQSLDPFNDIPSSIIEHILCLVPIKDAVRTSILSRSWRYRWTKIPELEFDLEDMVDEDELEKQLFADWSSDRKELMMRCKQFYAIHQVLRMHRGPILDFRFLMYEPDDDTFEICNVEIEQIILQLARTNNTLRKFTFYIASKDEDDYIHYELPRSIFLLRHLTDLHIENCTLDVVPTTLDGFGSLTSLFFLSGSFSEKPLLHLLANCPLLKKLELLLDLPGVTNRINIIELFKCLPLIEDLSICQRIIEDSDVPPELPIALVHLKRFCFYNVWLLNTSGLQFLSLVIKSSPNLEKIKLHISECDYDHLKGNDLRSDALQDCPDMKHLKKLEIRDFANTKHDLKFVKLILEKAPMLKKVRIFLCDSVDRDEELEIERNVLRYPRVSACRNLCSGFHEERKKYRI